MQSAIDGVTALFTSMMTLVSGIIFPAVVTPISLLAAFGLLFPVILIVVAFVKMLAKVKSG